MQIYLFKGNDGKIQTLNENSAHNELRNKGSWQRQDLVYLGECDDTPLKDIQANLKNTAIEQVLSELPAVKLLNNEIELAKMNEDVDTEKRKTLELSILKGRLDGQVRDRSQFISSEIDEIQSKIMVVENTIFDKAISELKPDPSKMPRNFNRLTSGFGEGAERPSDMLGNMVQ